MLQVGKSGMCRITNNIHAYFRFFEKYRIKDIRYLYVIGIEYNVIHFSMNK